MRNKPNKGWVKELASNPKSADSKKPFTYSKPVVPVAKPNSMAFNYRTREFKSVKPDKTTNLVAEQRSAKKSHKG